MTAPSRPAPERPVGLLTRGADPKKRFLPLLFALILPAYLWYFFFVERAVPLTGYWPSYLPIDDQIPFLEGFIVFYYLWYVMLGSVGLYLLFFDGKGFSRYMIFVGVSFGLAMTFCLFFPNGQDLRPDLASLGRDNVFIRLIAAIYRADTNTNVLPSVHVIGVFAVFFGVIENEALKRKKWPVALTAVCGTLVSLSTVFVKQHSLLDVILAIPYSLLLYLLLYKLLFRQQK